MGVSGSPDWVCAVVCFLTIPLLHLHRQESSWLYLLWESGPLCCVQSLRTSNAIWCGDGDTFLLSVWWNHCLPCSRQPVPGKVCSQAQIHFKLDRFPFFLQGLRPVVSTEAPPIIFATPTKLSSSSIAYDYAGKNTVPELQKFFQVREDTLKNSGGCEMNRLKTPFETEC